MGFVHMVRTVERIEQELALLDQAMASIAQEFHDIYSQYLTVLGHAMRQQLILASYHLCTHGYPEQFLNLSLVQRQKLQQALRQLAKEGQTKLLAHLQRVQPAKTLREPSRALAGPVDQLREAVLDQHLTLEEIAIGSVEFSSEAFNVFLSEQEPTPDLIAPNSIEPGSPHNDLAQPDPTQLDLMESNSIGSEAAEAGSESGSEPGSEPVVSESIEPSPTEQPTAEQSQTEQSPIAPEPSEPRPLHPKDLVIWQEQLEESIVDELQTLSHAANRLLQQTEILPSRLPEPVLEVAAKADIASESAVSPPNLLNLLIETEDEDEKESTMTQLMAIRLRLSEIEFSDSASTIYRSRIRDLSTRLNKLGREYQKKQKERSVAQAEAAWRSSWYED